MLCALCNSQQCVCQTCSSQGGHFNLDNLCGALAINMLFIDICVCMFQVSLVPFGKAILVEQLSLPSPFKMMSVEDIRAMLVDLSAVGDDMEQEQVAMCAQQLCHR